ncbi:MAG TPA: DUF2279 domain-containing protein [Burkholderiales bacterium]|nr:DUF2279 domain-containing protein [Burkholderiales bacterium]
MDTSWVGRPIETARLMVAVACMAGAPYAAAQLRPPQSPFPEDFALAQAPAGPDSALPGEGRQTVTPTSEQLRLRNAAVIGGGILLVGAYGAAKWWQDGFTGDFRTQKEGWFGQNTSSGGADKLGHAFSAYVGTRLVAQAFNAVGNEPEPARRLAAWSTLAVMLGIEVLDGYSKKYSFSWEDALMNVAGVGIGYLMERNRELDNLLDFRLLYRKSEGSNFDPAGDYSGQTYLLVAKASGVPALRENSVLRYFELAAGYGTRGYQSPPGVERERKLYFGVSVNLSEVLAQTVFRGAKDRGFPQRATDLFLEFVQVPGTAALASHRM